MAGGGRQLLSSPSQAAEVREVLVPLHRVCPPGSPMGGGLGLHPPPPAASQSRARAGLEQAWPERASRIPCQPPPPTAGPGRNPECAAPTLGGPSPGSADHFLLGSPGWARLLPRPPWLQAGGILPRGPPPVGPLDHSGLALIGWARGSVYRQPSLWRREPGGEGGGRELVAGRAKPWDPHA